MRKTILAVSLGAMGIAASSAAFAQAAASTEAKPPYTITANVTLASEYLYRGIAQTRGDVLRLPAREPLR